MCRYLKQNDEIPLNEQQLLEDNYIIEELPALLVKLVGNIVRNNLIETYFS